MGAKTSNKAVAKNTSRAKGTAKKKPAKRSSTKTDAKYAETGAPWWKRYLPA